MAERVLPDTVVSGTRPARAPRQVAFHRPPVMWRSAAAASDAILTGSLKAGGGWTARCEQTLAGGLAAGAPAPLLLQSCTAALELSALLLGVGPGDEVVMPSFTFASSATAFALRGATPVFVDVDPRTLGVDPAAVAAAITSRTRAVVAMHYAGVAADVDRLLLLTGEAGIPLVEDAAHCVGASLDGRPLGSFGALGTLSFDATKNVTSGSGGALLVRDPAVRAEAEVLRDYGTDRARLVRGEISRYRWQAAGSNLALNELGAACLHPQLEELDRITATRRGIWAAYHERLEAVAATGRLRRPHVPAGARHNGHAYWLVLDHSLERERVVAGLAERGVQAAGHYVPLHSAPAGLRHGRTAGPLVHTDAIAERLLRLPLHTEMDAGDVDHVVEALLAVLEARGPRRGRVLHVTGAPPAGAPS